MGPRPLLHWFRYSLRTMFVLVTVVAIWLGWELQGIRERRAFLVAMDELREIEFKTPKSFVVCRGLQQYVADPVATIPFWRRRLGDLPCGRLRLPCSCSAADFAKAKQLFPEAIIERAEN